MDTGQLDLIVKGNLVLPHDVIKDASVGVKKGVIVGFYQNEETPAAKNTVDASGSFVFPGMVDAHVHSYSDPEETFDHATPAAAAGGGHHYRGDAL